MGDISSFRLIGKTSAYQTKFYPNTELKNFQYRWTPEESSPLAWYDASDTSTITESSSVVSQVDDKSGNGFHLNVSTANKVGPKTGIQTLNGLNVLTWDVPNQVLENNLFSYDQNSNQLYFAVILKCDINNSQDFIIAGTQSVVAGERMSLRRSAFNNSMQILGGSGTGSNIGFVTNDNVSPEGVDTLTVVKFNGTSSYIRIDGSLEASGDIGTNAFSSLNVGANESERQSINGYIAELVFFEDSSAQEKIEGYLAHKWGISDNLPVSHQYKYQSRYFI